MSDEKRTVGAPHDRKTRLCDAMIATLRAHPEVRADDLCVVFLTDEQGGGLILSGYDRDTDAVTDVLLHLRAILRAQGNDLIIAPLSQRNPERN